MPFTDRFIRIPIRVYNLKEKELTGKENLEDSYEMIYPFDISRYRPTFDEESPEEKCTCISFKDGKETIAYLSIVEFEKLLNAIK